MGRTELSVEKYIEQYSEELITSTELNEAEKESIKESNLDLIDENTKIDFPLSYNIGSIGKLYTHKNRIVAINNNIKNSVII